jgi:hypothetical protein
MPLRIFGNMTAPVSGSNFAQVSALMPAGTDAAVNNLTAGTESTYFLEAQNTLVMRYGANATGTGGSAFAEMTILTGRIYEFRGFSPTNAWIRSADTTARLFSLWQG